MGGGRLLEADTAGPLPGLGRSSTEKLVKMRRKGAARRRGWLDGREERSEDRQPGRTSGPWQTETGSASAQHAAKAPSYEGPPARDVSWLEKPAT